MDYIVRNTLGPLVEERREALEARLAEIAKLRGDLRRMRKNDEYIARELRNMEPLKTLLDVKVLDPAMGSGHFLVAAVDYLTDEFSRIISELDAEPVVEELAELRAEIRASLEAYGASATDEQLSDANLLKRMVLKRCVYGVDLNEMAVELAKLSLWLDAFTVGAPLSFLDHHLKHGNSLIGSSVREVRREVETSGSLLGNQFTATLIQGTELMQHVGEIPDATEGEVRESIDAYAKADKVLAPYKRMLDIWTSQHFGNKQAERFLSMTVSTGDVDHLTRGDYTHFAGRDRETLDTAIELSDDKRFFHWELEFPEVFYEGARERENPGFDAVVGNPPYSSKLSTETTQLKPLFKLVSYRCDPFAFFVEQGLDLARRIGNLGYIMPSTWTGNTYYRDLRSALISTHSLRSVIFFDGLVFAEANVDTSVLLACKEGIKSRRFKVAISKPQQIEQMKWVEKPYEVVESSDRLDISPTVDIAWDKLMSKLSDASTKLSSITSHISLGLRVASVSKYTSEKQSDEFPDSLILGDNVERYKPLSPKVFFDHKSAPIVGGTKNPKVYEAQPKILMQSIRNQSLRRRLVPTLDEHGHHFGGNVVGVILNDSRISSLYLLALLASTMLNEFFARRFVTISLTSTFLGEIPICRVSFTTSESERRVAGEEAKELYEARDHVTIVRWSERELRWTPALGHSGAGRNDTVHDFLAYLAEQMNAMHRKCGEVERTWREWVETILPPNHKLTKTFLEQGWVKLGFERGWEGVKAEFQARNAIPSGKALQDLRRETEEALEKLRPLYERIQRTDELIDQIVYRLYGLTEDEISVVEASGERG